MVVVGDGGHGRQKSQVTDGAVADDVCHDQRWLRVTEDSSEQRDYGRHLYRATWLLAILIMDNNSLPPIVTDDMW